MPELDKELQSLGFLPVVPTHVYGAAAQRPHGFLDAFMARAKLSKGAFYILPDDLEYVRKNFPVIVRTEPPRKMDMPPPILPAPTLSDVPPRPAQKKSEEMTEEQKKFFDLDEPCPKEDWEPIRDAYKEDLSSLTSKGCSSCQLNALRKKYLNFLKQ